MHNYNHHTGLFLMQLTAGMRGHDLVWEEVRNSQQGNVAASRERESRINLISRSRLYEGRRGGAASSSTLSTVERDATHPFPSWLARPAASRRRAYYVPEKEQRNNIKVTRNVLYVVGLDDMKDPGKLFPFPVRRLLPGRPFPFPPKAFPPRGSPDPL